MHSLSRVRVLLLTLFVLMLAPVAFAAEGKVSGRITRTDGTPIDALPLFCRADSSVLAVRSQHSGLSTRLPQSSVFFRVTALTGRCS